MNKYAVSAIVILLTLCLTGLGWLGYSNWQLRRQMASLQTAEPPAMPVPVPNFNGPASPAPNMPGQVVPNPVPNGPGQVNPSPLPGGPGQASPDPADPFDDFFSGNWDPLTEIERMQEHMRQLMQQGPGAAFGSGSSGNGQTFTFQSMQPDISMEESKDAYVVNITIPEGSDIELNTEVEGNEFVVSGKVSSKEENGSGNAKQSIVSSSSFSRSFYLDQAVDTLGMKSETHGDTMTITLPKVG